MAISNFGKLGFGTKMYPAADQSAYYTYTNTTPGTGIQITAGGVGSFDQTKPTLLIKNNNSINGSSNVNIYLDYLKLIVSTVGAGHTVLQATMALERNQNVARYTSGGSTITPQASATGQPIAGGATFNANGNGQVYFGAIVGSTTGGSQATVAHHVLKSHLEIQWDTFVFDFGAPEQQPQNGLVDNGTTQSHGMFNCPPVIIAPGEWFCLVVWGASMSTGTTFLFNGGYWEI